MFLKYPINIQNLRLEVLIDDVLTKRNVCTDKISNVLSQEISTGIKGASGKGC